jgi:hypothetical protein
MCFGQCYHAKPGDAKSGTCAAAASRVFGQGQGYARPWVPVKLVSVNAAALVFVALVLASAVVLLVGDRLNRRCDLPGHRRCPSCDIPVPTGARFCAPTVGVLWVSLDNDCLSGWRKHPLPIAFG